MPAYQGSDGRWRYRFTIRGRRYSGSAPKGSNTRRAAEALERDHAEKVAARRHTGKMPTLAEFAVRFLEYQKARRKPLSYSTQETVVRLNFLPHLGALRLDEITQQHIDAMVTALSEDLAPRTINTRLGYLVRMFSLAVEWGILTATPKASLFKVGKRTPRFLTEEEAQRLLDAAEPQWRTMMLFALRTGLRVGELRGLQWGDVDLERKLVTVRRTDPGRPSYAATTPKGGGDRSVPLTADAIIAMREIKPAKVAPSAWVWSGADYRGRPARPRSAKGCYSAFDRTATAAKVANASWHTLRHTFASWLAMRAVPLRVIQRWLGHASIVQTEVYAHLSPEFGTAAIDLLDLALAPSQGAAKSLPAGDEILSPGQPVTDRRKS